MKHRNGYWLGGEPALEYFDWAEEKYAGSVSTDALPYIPPTDLWVEIVLESEEGSEGPGVSGAPTWDLQLQRGDYGVGPLQDRWRFGHWD